MIELRELTKRYGDVVAVRSVSATIGAGEIVALLGPNGAGKSSAMRMLVGLDRPTAGSATITGRPYRELGEPLRMVGVHLEACGAAPARRAVDHLRWLALSNGLSRRRVDEALSLCGIDRVARRRAGRMSFGMRQRLGLAAALLGQPQVLILDEPSNGLDPEGIVWLRELLRSQGCAILMSSHLIAEVMEIADRVLVMSDGRLVADCETLALPVAAGQHASTRGGTLQQQRASLEDAYLALTSAEQGC